ncbi:MAG: peroxidase-related enzyme [Propionicimonas sp.]
MSRVPLIDPAAADAAVTPTLNRINGVFGTVPNMFRAVANSPAALQSMWGAFGAFATGSLGAALTEQIAVAVANRNQCRYCLAAHTALGANAGLDQASLAAAQQARAGDPRTQGLLEFVVALVEQRGDVDTQRIERLRELGWSDEQIVETIAQVALNLFTNYLNIALDVPVDFPEVPLAPRL